MMLRGKSREQASAPAQDVPQVRGVNGEIYDVVTQPDGQTIYRPVEGAPAQDEPEMSISFSKPAYVEPEVIYEQSPTKESATEVVLGLASTSDEIRAASTAHLEMFVNSLASKVKFCANDLLEAVQYQIGAVQAELESRSAAVEELGKAQARQKLLEEMSNMFSIGSLVEQPQDSENSTASHDGSFVDDMPFVLEDQARLKRTIKENKTPDQILAEEAAEHARLEALAMQQRQATATPPPLPSPSVLPALPAQAPHSAAADTEGTLTPDQEKKPGKKKFSRKTVIAVGVTAFTLIAGSIFVATTSGEDAPQSDVNVHAKTIADNQNKDILAKIAPEMTADKLKVGLCLNESTLAEGNVDGSAQALVFYKGKDGKTKALADKLPDGSVAGVQLDVNKAPVSIATCAPEALRAGIATMKDGIVTIDRKDMTVQVLLGEGGVIAPDITKIQADTVNGLDEAGAEGLRKKFDESVKNQNIATLAQVEVSKVIAATDSSFRTSVQAQADAASIANIKKQISDHNAAFNIKASNVEVQLIGEYADVVVAQPPEAAKAEADTKDFVKIAGGKVVKLTFPDIAKAGKK